MREGDCNIVIGELEATIRTKPLITENLSLFYFDFQELSGLGRC